MKGDKLYYSDGVSSYKGYSKIFHSDGSSTMYCGGDKFWFLNGKIHREDGPAIEFANGNRAWCLNEDLHRVDGPAIERVNKNSRWYLDGKLTPKKQYYKIMKEIEEMTLELRLTDPREWVRKSATKSSKSK